MEKLLLNLDIYTYRLHHHDLPIITLLHGGCWQAQYGLNQLGQLSQALMELGFAVWNLAYRRLGLFNLIAGQLPVTSGQVILSGQDITALPVNVCANLGIGRTFQRNTLFQGMTVLENVRLAVQHQQRLDWRWFQRVESFKQIDEATSMPNK